MLQAVIISRQAELSSPVTLPRSSTDLNFAWVARSMLASLNFIHDCGLLRKVANDQQDIILLVAPDGGVGLGDARMDLDLVRVCVESEAGLVNVGGLGLSAQVQLQL